MLQIVPEDLGSPDIRELIGEHLRDMHATSPPESVHALDLSGLTDPAVTMWAAREHGQLLGCGALKELDATSGEIKSMRTANVARRRGVGAALLEHLIAQAKNRAYRTLYLETGSQDFFAPARALYQRRGFTECGPFGTYVLDPNSVFMTLKLDRQPFVPVGFAPPTSLVTERFRLEPLGPQHNEADRAAWLSSIEHIRATPGFPDGTWPPLAGMSLAANLADLRRHAADFAAGKGFTFTVLDQADGDVIGCVYLYPATSTDHDVVVQSWVRADRADLDAPLAEAVAAWLTAEWPWHRPDRCGR